MKSEVDQDEEDDNISVARSEKAPSERSSREWPSNRIATAQRKLQLVNDPQVKKFTENSAECRVCRTDVTLKGDVEYDLTHWEEHKATCTKSADFLDAVTSSLNLLLR